MERHGGLAAQDPGAAIKQIWHVATICAGSWIEFSPVRRRQQSRRWTFRYSTCMSKGFPDVMRAAPRRRSSKLRFLPLLAATYFMVSGGPYDIEDIIGYGGYERALLLLVLLPFFWSFPVALMLGELASAVPAEGGFYAWVHRALGPFWGFQEAWLSLASSVFDMAI
jgi:hypothetical protein